MYPKVIFFFLTLFIISSFSWLAYQEKKQEEIKNQWFLYFQNPQQPDLNFVIENYTDNKNFKWLLLKNEQLVKKEDMIIKNKENKEIKINSNNFSGKIIVKVQHNGEEKEIYKILK